MQVIKKDGRIQSLDVIKIRSSILGASIDSNTIINEADLNFALAAVKTSKVFCEAHKVRRTNEYKLMTSEIYN